MSVAASKGYEEADGRVGWAGDWQYIKSSRKGRFRRRHQQLPQIRTSLVGAFGVAGSADQIQKIAPSSFPSTATRQRRREHERGK